MSAKLNIEPLNVPVYREELDALASQGCEGCGGHHHAFFLHSRCHPNSDIEAEYKEGGQLAVRCKVCGLMSGTKSGRSWAYDPEGL